MLENNAYKYAVARYLLGKRFAVELFVFGRIILVDKKKLYKKFLQEKKMKKFLPQLSLGIITLGGGTPLFLPSGATRVNSVTETPSLFTNVKPAAPQPKFNFQESVLQGKNIKTVTQDSFGNVIVGADDGLYISSDGGQTFDTVSIEGQTFPKVTQVIAEKTPNLLWVLTNQVVTQDLPGVTGVLYKLTYNGAIKTSFSKAEKISIGESYSVESIALNNDTNKHLFLTVSNVTPGENDELIYQAGLNNNYTFTNYWIPSGNWLNTSKLYLGPNHHLWFGANSVIFESTEANPVATKPETRGAFKSFGVKTGVINAFVQGNNHRLYVGSQGYENGATLWYADLSQTTPVFKSIPLPNLRPQGNYAVNTGVIVNTGVVPSEQTVYFGTNHGGVYQVNSGVTTATKVPGVPLTVNVITSAAFYFPETNNDYKPYLFMGTQSNGLFRYNFGKETFEKFAFLADGVGVNAFAYARFFVPHYKDKLFLGTTNGLTYFNVVSPTSLYIDASQLDTDAIYIIGAATRLPSVLEPAIYIIKPAKQAAKPFPIGLTVGLTVGLGLLVIAGAGGGWYYHKRKVQSKSTNTSKK